jgi:hypothetical protein
MRSEAHRHRREIQQLRVENEILREAAQPLIHHAPARERFAFIDRLRDRFSVKRLCRVTITDRGSFYGWARAQVRRNKRAYDEQELTVRIVEIHTARPAYGAERITRELKRQGIEIGRRVVTRLMKANGIKLHNERRLHSSLGYQTPAEMRRAWEKHGSGRIDQRCGENRADSTAAPTHPSHTS